MIIGTSQYYDLLQLSSFRSLFLLCCMTVYLPYWWLKTNITHFRILAGNCFERVCYNMIRTIVETILHISNNVYRLAEIRDNISFLCTLWFHSLHVSLYTFYFLFSFFVCVCNSCTILIISKINKIILYMPVSGVAVRACRIWRYAVTLWSRAGVGGLFKYHRSSPKVNAVHNYLQME